MTWVIDEEEAWERKVRTFQQLGPNVNGMLTMEGEKEKERTLVVFFICGGKRTACALHWKVRTSYSAAS